MKRGRTEAKPKDRYQILTDREAEEEECGNGRDVSREIQYHTFDNN